MKKYRSKAAGQRILNSYDLLLKQWDIQIEEMDVPSRYGVTHVILAGKQDAPPLVLFHGVGDDSALMWVYNAKALADHFRIYAVDTIGGSGKSEMGASYGKDFDDVLWIDDLLDKLGIENTNMAGVSHGGYLVQLYTLRRPKRVRKAICISSSVPNGKNGSPLKAMMKIFMPEALFPTAGNTEKLLRKLSGDHAEVFTNNPAVMNHYQALLKGFNNMAMSYHKVECFSDDEISQIRNQILYLAGEKDPFQLLGGRNALIEHQMHAIFYPDAGHGLNHELSAQINRQMIEYLSFGGISDREFA